MESSANEIYVYRTHLYPLNEVRDFEIADKNPDIRGWQILGNDGVKFGTVKELIVDTKALKVRYLDVDINKNVHPDHKEDLHILVPIGLAILNKDDKNVIIPELSIADLKAYPVYRREPVYVLHNYERSVRDFFAGERYTAHQYDPEFYEDKYYSDSKFF